MCVAREDGGEKERTPESLAGYELQDCAVQGVKGVVSFRRRSTIYTIHGIESDMFCK